MVKQGDNVKANVGSPKTVDQIKKELNQSQARAKVFESLTELMEAMQDWWETLEGGDDEVELFYTVDKYLGLAHHFDAKAMRHQGLFDESNLGKLVVSWFGEITSD